MLLEVFFSPVEWVELAGDSRTLPFARYTEQPLIFTLELNQPDLNQLKHPSLVNTRALSR